MSIKTIIPNFSVLILIILAVNIVALLLIKSEKKYWLFSIPFWAVLLISFFIFRIITDKKIEIQEKVYWESIGTKGYGDHNKRADLVDAKVSAMKINSTLLNILGIQTLLTFFLQLKGKQATNLRIYKWTIRIFAVLSVICIFLGLMMAISPSTGFVT